MKNSRPLPFGALGQGAKLAVQTFTARRGIPDSLVPVLEKFVFCLTGPYLTGRATIGRLELPPWRGAVRLRAPYAARLRAAPPT